MVAQKRTVVFDTSSGIVRSCVGLPVILYKERLALTGVKKGAFESLRKLAVSGAGTRSEKMTGPIQSHHTGTQRRISALTFQHRCYSSEMDTTEQYLNWSLRNLLPISSVSVTISKPCSRHVSS